MQLRNKSYTNSLAAEPHFCRPPIQRKRLVLRTTTQINVTIKWMQPRNAHAPPSDSDDVRRPQKRCFSSPEAIQMLSSDPRSDVLAAQKREEKTATPEAMIQRL